MSPIVGHSPSRSVRRQDRAALRLVHRRAGGPDCSFREDVAGVQSKCISIGHGGRINLKKSNFKANRFGSRCRFGLVSMLFRVNDGSINQSCSTMYGIDSSPVKRLSLFAPVAGKDAPLLHGQ